MSIIYTGEKDAKQFKGAFGETLKALLEADDKVCWLDADLMSCCGVASLYGKSDRVINCGIAEANMVGIASGMASTGMKPYCHSFGIFASRRCYDQAFLSAGYGKNAVTIIGTDPGVTAAYNGGTHMPFEDTALYRALPGSVIFDITDIAMFKKALWMAKDLPGVKYIRVPRKTSYPVYSDDHEFEVGKGEVLREGTDVTVVASGIMVHEAMEAAKQLEQEGISVAVIDPVTVKPLDKKLIREYAKKTGRIVATENHNMYGGLCSAVTEAIAGIACRYDFVAVEDEFGEVGPQDYLQKRFGLTDVHLINVIHELMEQ